jgi:hypothetical protein
MAPPEQVPATENEPALMPRTASLKVSAKDTEAALLGETVPEPNTMLPTKAGPTPSAGTGNERNGQPARAAKASIRSTIGEGARLHGGGVVVGQIGDRVVVEVHRDGAARRARHAAGAQRVGPLAAAREGAERDEKCARVTPCTTSLKLSESGTEVAFVGELAPATTPRAEVGRTESAQQRQQRPVNREIKQRKCAIGPP